MNELYIIENGLFHFCVQLHKFHAKYEKTQENTFICAYLTCNIEFPSILALPFKQIDTAELGWLPPHEYFIGSKKIFSNLKNRSYKVLNI